MGYEGGMPRLFTEDEVRKLIATAVAEAMAPLQRRIAELEAEVARLRKNSGNSSKPPSSDIVKPPQPNASQRIGKGRRSIGGQPGHAKHERKPFGPEEVDRVVQCELGVDEAKGLRPLQQWRVVQQVELVEKPFVITEYRARLYRDPRSGATVVAPLPAEVVAAGLVGPRLSAAIAFQKAACHMSYTTIQTFWRDLTGLNLSRGHLAKVVRKASSAIRTTYEELRSALAGQDRLGIDESGHKDAGQRRWTWCFRAPRFTVFHIDPSRGSQVLRTVLGETFGGVIGCDYFSAYHKYMADSGATVQFCMAHLIRDVRFLAEQPHVGVARWAEKLLGWLRKLFHTLHRRDQGTAKTFAARMDAIRGGFLQAARHPPSWSEARTLAARFRGRNAEHYFTFLTQAGVEPTNNLTEQAIRHVVIDRRVTQGTRGERGMRWCERAWTVLATCTQQGRRAFQFFHNAIHAHFKSQPAPSLLT
jgi:transposase